MDEKFFQQPLPLLQAHNLPFAKSPTYLLKVLNRNTNRFEGRMKSQPYAWFDNHFMRIPSESVPNKESQHA